MLEKFRIFSLILFLNTSMQDFSLSVRKLFYIVEPLKPIAKRVNPTLKSHIFNCYQKILLDISKLLMKILG